MQRRKKEKTLMHFSQTELFTGCVYISKYIGGTRTGVYVSSSPHALSRYSLHTFCFSSAIHSCVVVTVHLAAAVAFEKCKNSVEIKRLYFMAIRIFLLTSSFTHATRHTLNPSLYLSELES